MTLSKQFTLREKVLLVILALLLVAVSYFWFVQQPVERSMSEIALAREEADMQRVVLEAKRQRLEEMQAELAAIAASPDAAVETPDYDNLQNVMVFLNGVLSSAGDYSLDFQNVELPEEGDIVRRVINMTFTVPAYDQASELLARLHGCPFRCQLGALALTPAAAEGEAPFGEPGEADLAAGPVQVSLTLTFFESL